MTGVVGVEGAGSGGGRLPVGRDAEVARVRELLAVPAAWPQALLLEGPAGIGKTALWSYGLEAARDGDLHALSCRPAGSEVQLAFAALGDLVEPVADLVLPQLSVPQRDALEVALLRRSGPAPNPRAVGLALLEALRRLAHAKPVVVGVDDLQWLDPASAHALQFAFRRLAVERVAVIATERIEGGARASWLEDAFGGERFRRVRLGALSMGAVNELLRARLGVQLRRGTLVRIYDASEGNAFVALELAREVADRGELAPGEPLPLPGGLAEVVEERLGHLPATARRVLLAAAALTRPSVEQLTRLDRHAERALGAAEREGVIEIEGGVVRFAHPLLALLPYGELAASERRRLHARLATVAASAEERARHLALSVQGSDSNVAAELDAAAVEAGARGAPETAAELSALAAWRSPSGEEALRCERLLSAAEWHQRAGELTSAVATAEEALSSTVAGAAKARAYALLGSVRCDTESVAAGIELYERALREPDAPAELCAEVHQKLAWIRFAAGDSESAGRHAHAAVTLAGKRGAIAASAAATAAQVEVARTGRVPRRLLARALALERSAQAAKPSVWIETVPTVLEGVVFLWAGELEAAAAPLRRIHTAARENGDPWLMTHSLAYLSALETGLGDPRRGLELAGRYLALAEESESDAHRAGALWPLAVAGAWLGRVDEARAAAREAVEIAEQTGHRLYLIGGLCAEGNLELSLGRAAPAAACLAHAYELARDSGIVTHGRFSIAPSLVEALLELGEVGRAEEVAADLASYARDVRRPWALALAGRCAGSLAAARGDSETAAAAFRQSLADHRRQPRRLAQARTQLAHGRVLRRAGRKRDARDALEAARDAFESAGAAAWRERAAEELRRIGGRRAPAGDALSVTEAQIAELVASGRSNAEAAAALQLSPRTVEWNLTKIYRKLAVRSRSELAATLRADRG